MLALTVKIGQAVTLQTLDGEVRITQLSERFGSPRIGFEAPKSVSIVRDNAIVKEPPPGRHKSREGAG